MKRIHCLVMAIACGCLAASVPVSAQEATPAPTDWFEGRAHLMLLGRDTIDSSKFEEYRIVPKGMSMPLFSLAGRQKGAEFALFGEGIAQRDQRYTGFARTGWLGLKFDYNQIPHAMGNDGRTIMTELSRGVWGMSATLRQALGDRVNAQLPAATRNYAFFADLYAPTIASASFVDLNALRQRGTVEVALGQNLPFDTTARYMRELKSGTRGAGGGSIRGFSDNIVEVPEPLNELTQDVGLLVALNRGWGNVHAGFNHNWYNNRQETLIVDNPLVAFDQPYTVAAGAIPARGGTSRALFIGPPDNSANTGAFGGLLKFAHQTRLGADAVIGRWVQNAQLYPYTIFSRAVTGAGTPGDNRSSLQFQSLDGKINTTALTFFFSSRPVPGLGLRARYRGYDLDNKTPAIPRVGSFAASPDRLWSNTDLTTTPLGYITASPYGYTTRRFDGSASYDLKLVTVEAAYRHARVERTYREAEEAKETGYTLSATMRAADWLNVRASFDDASRTAGGPGVTSATRLPADEAERDSTRTGINVELTPNSKVAFVVAYFRREAEYKNPNAVAGVDGTAYGLLETKYDTITGEVDFTPTERMELNVFYTYEKNLSTTQAFSGGTTLLGRLTFEGSDETDTFGANARFHLVPDKWMATLRAQRQKLDGLMDITGDPRGSFALARASYGGIQDIPDYSDTTLTTINAQVDYTVTKAWGLSLGYWHEKYDFTDAFSAGTEIYPLAGAFYLKANDGAYKANVAYAKLNYSF